MIFFSILHIFYNKAIFKAAVRCSNKQYALLSFKNAHTLDYLSSFSKKKNLTMQKNFFLKIQIFLLVEWCVSPISFKIARV